MLKLKRTADKEGAKSKSKSNPKLRPKLLDCTRPPKTVTLVPQKKAKPKSKDLTNIIANKREAVSRCKSRPKSSLSTTYRKPKDIKCNIKLAELCTQEDMIVLSQQYEPEVLPTVLNFKKADKTKGTYTRQEAATLIQKLWRGYMTRQIVKYYIGMYKSTEKRSELDRTHKKRNAKHVGKIANENNRTLKSRCQIKISMDISISPIKDYNFNTDQERPVTSSDTSKASPVYFEQPQPIQQVVLSQIEYIDPIQRVIQMQIKLLAENEQEQLATLVNRLKKNKVPKSLFDLKKLSIVRHYEQQRLKLIRNRSQIRFGFLKTPMRDIQSNYRGATVQANYSQQVLAFKKAKFQDDDNDNLSLQMDWTYRQSRVLTTSEPDIDQINTSDIESMDNIDNIDIDIARQRVDAIQDRLQNILIDEVTAQLYLNRTFNSALFPYFDMQSSYKYPFITNTDISKFIDAILSTFRPTQQELLKRLNQKINPTAKELLKILRNQDGELDDQFYQLVLPEYIFKTFREYKEKQPEDLKFLQHKHPVNMETLSQRHRQQMNVKQREFDSKKKKIWRFEKDIQAMYYKAVFNCLNESIIEVKCSYCPINGRSTIGPGELRVSLLDSNSNVNPTQIPMILKKAKEVVMLNFKYSCPNLVVTSYQSVYNFQQTLMKQLSLQLCLNQHRWMSFFDQYLEIAIELSSQIIDSMFLQVTKEIHQIQLKR